MAVGRGDEKNGLKKMNECKLSGINRYLWYYSGRNSYTDGNDYRRSINLCSRNEKLLKESQVIFLHKQHPNFQVTLLAIPSLMVSF